MISANYPRISFLVGQKLIAVLSQEAYQVTYRKFIKEFQAVTAVNSQMYFEHGRAKVNGTFPNIGLEVQARRDTWAATSHTKDIEVSYDIYVAVKVLAGGKSIDEGAANPVEQYIITLAEFVLELLNEPQVALQYTITTDQDGDPLTTPLRIYDSLASEIQYGFLYNGAVRIGKIPWSGKIMRLGPSGQTLQPGY